MKKTFSVLMEMDEHMFHDLKMCAERESRDLGEIANEALKRFLNAKKMFPEGENVNYSNLSEALDIPEEKIREFATYLSNYSEAKNAFLYQELGNLARFIVETQKDVSHVNLKGITKDDIPETSDQLEGILEATEEATDQILSATESILEMLDLVSKSLKNRGETCLNIKIIDGKNMGNFLDEMRTETMKILSACNFQDLTGQRIQKIVSLIRKIESKIMDLIVWYDQVEDKSPLDQPQEIHQDNTHGANEDGHSEHSLLKGPQRKAEAFDQDDIDTLLSDLGF